MRGREGSEGETQGRNLQMDYITATDVSQLQLGLEPRRFILLLHPCYVSYMSRDETVSFCCWGLLLH